MTRVLPAIDLELLDDHVTTFRSFVEKQSGVPFESFAQHPYVDQQEGYKESIARKGRDALQLNSWKSEDIGTSKICRRVIAAIEIKANNLAQWEPRYGPKSRPHHPLHQALEEPNKLPRIERVLHNLYRTPSDEANFNSLVEILGRRYPIVAYLLFLKDPSRYLPIAPRTLDEALDLLGATARTSHQCSWENYLQFLNVIGELREELEHRLGTRVSLLDAHSFAWMLTRHIPIDWRPGLASKFRSLPKTEREALSKARIGQGAWRHALLLAWNECSVTSVDDERVLIASHIKPWSQATNEERLDPYNGLLLTSTLDACFDKGLLSFADDGTIVFSKTLSPKNRSRLHLSEDMRLRRVKEPHLKYLRYHRKNILI